MCDNVHCYRHFGRAGPCTTVHHQYLQMVDLMTLHCKRSMNGLNAFAFSYEPTEHNTNHVEENDATIKGEKMEYQQSRINKLMTR